MRAVDIQKLRYLISVASPGPWSVEEIEEDGVLRQVLFDSNGQAVADTVNAHPLVLRDGSLIWDEQGRRNMALIQELHRLAGEIAESEAWVPFGDVPKGAIGLFARPARAVWQIMYGKRVGKGVLVEGRHRQGFQFYRPLVLP